MRKYILIIPLFLLLFIPFNVNAYVDSSWHAGYDSSSMNHTTSNKGYTGAWSGEITGYNASNVSIYYNNIEFSPGRNDFLEFPILVEVSPLNFSAAYEGVQFSDDGGYSNYILYNYGLIITFYASQETPEGNPSTTVCTLFANQTNDAQIISGVIRCPLNGVANKLTNLRANIIWNGRNGNQLYKVFFGATGWVNFVRHDMVDSETIVSAQQQTTAAINNMNSSINNSSTTDANSKGSSFFSNFGSHDNAHLTTIITAPLRLFNAMQTECTQPISIPIGFNNSTNGDIPNRNINISCYANFWNRDDVQTFRSFWNLLIGGPAIYGLLVLLMKAFNKALDPLEDGLIAIDIAPNKVKKDKGSDEQV